MNYMEHKINKDRILILIETNPDEDIFFYDWIKSGYHAGVIFKKMPKFLRFIRRFFLMYNLPFSSIWYGEWYKELDNYDTVIIHMNHLTRYIPKKIIDRNSMIYVKCWYWNTINIKNKPIIFDKRIDYYSFDKNDCAKYEIKYNIQYYCEQERANDNDIKYDVYFIGMDKKRKNIIKNIEDRFNSIGLICNFKIVNNVKDFIPYNKIKDEIRNTKSILDINKEKQTGYSLRVLESLFYEKKLITNNKDIVNIEFYNNNNIFIIDVDDNNKLYDFINSDYNTDVNKYKKNYNLDTWINNFFE